MIRGFGLSSSAPNYKDALREVREWLDRQEGVPTPAIKVDGRKTTVTLPDGRVGVSRCCPEDDFDIITGIRVALDDIEKKYPRLSDEEKSILKTFSAIGAVYVDAGERVVYFRTPSKHCMACCDKNDMFKFLDERRVYKIEDLLHERS